MPIVVVVPESVADCVVDDRVQDGCAHSADEEDRHEAHREEPTLDGIAKETVIQRGPWGRTRWDYDRAIATPATGGMP